MDYSRSVAYNYNEATQEYTKCYPLTHMNAVYTKDDESETLNEKLINIDNNINSNSNKIGVLTTSVDNVATQLSDLTNNHNKDNVTTGYTLTPTDLHFDCTKVISKHVGSGYENGEEFLTVFEDNFANDPNQAGAKTLIKYSSLNGDNITYECSKSTSPKKNIYVAHSSVAQSIPSKTWTTINFDTDAINNNTVAVHNTTANTSKIYIPKTGIYRFTYNIGFVEINNIGVRDAVVIKNGSINLTANTNNASNYQTPLPDGLTRTTDLNGESVEIQCSVGDYIELSVYQDSGESLNTDVGNYYPSLSVVRVDEDINSTNIELGCATMNFTNSGADYAEALYSTPIVPIGSVFHAVLEVAEDDTSFAPRVGLIKDQDNWVHVVYSKIPSAYSAIEVKVGGTVTTYTGTYPTIPFKAPYKLHFMLHNVEVIMAIEKDGKMYKLCEQDISAKINFTTYNTLKSYNLFFGCTIKGNGQHGRLSGLKAGYSIGTSFAQDFRPVTYENGQPIKRNGWMYFLGSSHPCDNILGAIGVKLFRFNGIKFEFIGMLFNRVGTRIFAGNSDKLFYDRNINKFVYISGNWSDSPVVTYIGTTDEDILKGGIFTINTSAMNLPNDDATHGVYDMDMCYFNGKYNIVYCLYAPAQYLCLAQSDSYNGTYTKTTSATISGSEFWEGNVFTKIGGQYYITHSKGSTALGIYKATDLSYVGTLNTNRHPADANSETPPPWGCVIPVVNKYITKYMALIFSPRKTLLNWNGSSWVNALYGYGDTWVYESREIQPAQEFENDDRLFFD